MPKPVLELRASRLFAAWLWLVALAAAGALAVSAHPPGLKAALACLAVACLVKAWQDDARRGLRYLGITGDGAVALAHADGSERTAAYAGHAVLGSFLVFVYTERAGWRRWLGPERHAVFRDAADADEFRRLRAWVRLGL